MHIPGEISGATLHIRHPRLTLSPTEGSEGSAAVSITARARRTTRIPSVISTSVVIKNRGSVAPDTAALSETKILSKERAAATNPDTRRLH